MKVQSLALATAFAMAALSSPVIVSGADCTDKDLGILGRTNTSAVEKACPSLYADGKDAIYATNAGSFTDTSLKALAPCGETACITQLQKLEVSTPDCSINGRNIKTLYSATVQLCTEFSKGTVTVASATELFKNIAQNMSAGFEDDRPMSMDLWKV